MEHQKNALRKWAKERRVGLTPDSESLCGHLGDWLDGPERKPGYVVIYDSMPGELDLSRLVESSQGPFATTSTPTSGWDLTIHPWESERERHRFGYMQPIPGSQNVPDASVSVVLVPALVFDRSGNRLGWGAGYYDRLLSRLSESVSRVGISDGTILASIEVEPHDIPMDYIATRSGVKAVPLGAWLAGK